MGRLVDDDLGGGDRDRTAVAAALRAGPGPHRVGVPVLVRVVVINVGTARVWMTGVLDGSETATRRPYYRPTVLRDGEIVAAPPQPEDPLVGPLRPEDFRRLEPGQWFDPTDRSGGPAYLPLSTFDSFRPNRPGTYRYTLVLDTTGPEEQWMGRFGQEPFRAGVLPLLALVPKVVLNAVVDIDVEP
ncbi:MAG: hypothetical protein M3186_01160 [Actinomycetota bacterium]|nr:hypothetical protein [Actinomycetota bacterium]